MTYGQAVEFLNNSFTSFQTAGRSAYKEGLESITRMCEYLGNPHRNYRTIHVAGTNGKGSVAHTLASALQSAGYCVGLYTSPHLNDFRERIRVDGRLIPERAVAGFVEEHGDKMVELELSYFEMTTAMAFDYFGNADVEVAVIETGLGGRLDATNIIRPELTVITNIGFDHTDILGSTLEDIAAEKAGIIKRGVPVVIGESNEKTDPVFERRAEEMNAPIIFAEQRYEWRDLVPEREYDRYVIHRFRDDYDDVFEFGLTGSYQSRNLITARAAVSAIRHLTQLNVSTRAMKDGFRNVVEYTGIQGRWQIIGRDPIVVCDTGHNAHGLKYVTEQIARQRFKELYMVIGFAADKNIEEILKMLPTQAYYIFTQADSPRAFDAGKLADLGRGYGLTGEVVYSVRGAYDRAKELASEDDMIFIGGSSYVVAEIV